MTGLAILVVAMLTGVAFGLANEKLEPRSVLARFGRKRLQRRERLRELERWYDDTYHESAALIDSDALQSWFAKPPHQEGRNDDREAGATAARGISS